MSLVDGFLSRCGQIQKVVCGVVLVVLEVVVVVVLEVVVDVLVVVVVVEAVEVSQAETCGRIKKLFSMPISRV